MKNRNRTHFLSAKALTVALAVGAGSLLAGWGPCGDDRQVKPTPPETGNVTAHYSFKGTPGATCTANLTWRYEPVGQLTGSKGKSEAFDVEGNAPQPNGGECLSTKTQLGFMFGKWRVILSNQYGPEATCDVELSEQASSVLAKFKQGALGCETS
jgi:hypothetical protein